jgi:fatty acid omega-hydroxylase
MFEVFTEQSEKLVDLLHGVAERGQEIDFQVLMADFTFDVICRVAFGIDLEQLPCSVTGAARHSILQSFDFCQGKVMYRSFGPAWLWKLKRYLRVGVEGAYASHIERIHTFLQNMIEERRRNPEEHQGDLLSMYTEHERRRAELPEHERGTEPPMTDQTLRGLILGFMIAGRDTTAVALTFMFRALDVYRNEQEKILKEIREKLPRDVQPNHQDIRGLVHLEAAFMETIRVWPPAPQDAKQNARDVVFPDGSHVPKGCRVFYSPHVLNRLPQYYEACTTPQLKTWAKDCMEWKPDRWIIQQSNGGELEEQKGHGEAQGEGEELKLVNPPAWEYVSFNAGPRLCLGKNMAILEGKMVAAAILSVFEIRVRPGYEFKEKLGILYSMEDGLPVTVHKRKM